jgi:hypothetical protein
VILTPYTYVTVAIQRGETPHLDVGFYDGDQLRVSASVIDGRRPYLSISTREADVAVSSTACGPVTDADVQAARRIFDGAARYLAECERLHAEQAEHSEQAGQGSGAVPDDKPDQGARNDQDARNGGKAA